MKNYRLCFLGFGNVGRALARLFVSKSAELRDNYGVLLENEGIVLLNCVTSLRWSSPRELEGFQVRDNVL